MHIGEPRAAAGFVWRDLLDGSSAVSLNAPTTRVDYPLTASQANATDNQLLQLLDGSLLGIKNGYVWSNLTHPPAWFNTATISGQSSGQARNCIFVFRSTDSGRTWSEISLIDSAVAAGGDFGWPQGDGTAAGNGSKGVGGLDRCEAYQDPFTGHIYISGGGDGGPYVRSTGTVSNHAGVVFVSTDNGVTWSEQARFANQGKGGAPYVMTSTRNHPLIVFNLFNGPTLYHLAKNATSISAGQSVVLKVNGSTVSSAGDSGINDLRGVPPCIARVGTDGSHDQVWIAYPALNGNSRQVYQICLVTFDDSGQAPGVEAVATIQAEDPVNRAVAMGSLVQDTFADPGSANPGNVTMFYWIDAPPKTAADPNHLTARYKLLCNRIGQFQAGALSVSSGAERSFGRLGIGDYFKGGVFAWNGKLNFLAQWREPDADRANIVSV